MNNLTTIGTKPADETKGEITFTATQKSAYERVIEEKKETLVADRQKLQFQVELLNAQIGLLNDILNSGDIQKRKVQ